MSIETIFIIATVINLILVIINTWWAYKRTCYNRDTLSGSINYWQSWKERSKDVARSVLKNITTEDLKRELKRRQKK